jgi:Trk K+ transport system NAD-binding subunit
MSSESRHHPYNAIVNRDARLRRLRRRPRPFWRLAAASVYDLFLLVREARAALAGFALLTMVNAAYLLFAYDYAAADVPRFTVLSALYETLRMLSLETDLPIPEGDLLGDLLFFLTPLLGLALVLQSVLNFGRFILDKGSRREGWQISLARTYRGHVIVCGLGSMTYQVIHELLAIGFGVVAIERDWSNELLEPTLAIGVPVIHGDARNPEVLRDAGLARARSLIAGLNDDLANVEIGLTARRTRAALPIVLRIFNDELDLNLEQTFGHNSVFSASALAAPTLAAAALGRAIAHVLPLPPQFAHGDGAPRILGVLQLTITPGSEFVGPLRQLEERFDVRAMLHLKGGRMQRDGARRRPGGGQLQPGDVIALLGPLPQLEQARLLNHGFGEGQEIEVRSFSRTPLPGAARAYDTVIVCGLGKIGYNVVKALALMRPRPRVVLVYQGGDTDPELVEEVRSLIVAMHPGDARLISVLRRVGIDRACAVIAATSDDLTNLQIGLAARRAAPDIDLVLRVYNEDLAERLEAVFGIHTTFSVAALAAPTLSAAAIVQGVDYAIEIADQLYSTATIRVGPGSPLEGRTVGELRRRAHILALAARRAGDELPLKLDTALRAGDEVVALVDIVRLEQLRSQGVLQVEAAPAPRPAPAVDPLLAGLLLAEPGEPGGAAHDRAAD